jgi:hypothetical protein
MPYFSIAHVLQRRDGLFAVRSTEFPACEGCDFQVWQAREQFRQALSEHVRQMIQQGEMPSLHLSLEEAEAGLREHCKMQIPAPDRRPRTYDYPVIIEVSLADDDAERLAAMKIDKLLPETRW